MGADDGEEKKSLFGGLPGYNETIAKETGFNPGLLHTEVPCGDCGELRAGTRTYYVVFLVFLCGYVYAWSNEVLRCPRCMRVYLGSWLVPAMVLPNPLPPFMRRYGRVLLVRPSRRHERPRA